MPEGKKKKNKKAAEENRTPSQPEQARSSLEEDIKTYIAAYIDSYMDYVEELSIVPEDFPLFYTYYPFDVRGHILPDNSTCILFRGLAAATLIEVKKADFDVVDKDIAERKYDHICCYPPSHRYTKEEAAKQAREDVERDVENTRLLKNLDAEKSAKDHSLKSIRLLTVVVPWAIDRKTKKGGLPHLTQTGATKFAPENLRIKEGEDFSSFSDRLKNLESSLLRAREEGLAPSEGKVEAETPPKPIETSAAKVTPGPTAIPVPSTVTPTNISIEIKQPETIGKGEAYEDKRDLDILRLKKTLYIQTTDIEDLKRKVNEMSTKLGNIEQMRQTVFRMNRKVYDTDARMTNVEKSNREMMRKVAEMSAEQREENKKMRRFITEKSKKARNQAMTLAVIAIVISLVTLPFLIMLLIKFWDQIKSMLGF